MNYEVIAKRFVMPECFCGIHDFRRCKLIPAQKVAGDRVGVLISMTHNDGQLSKGMKNMKEVVIVSGAGTAVGSFGGALKDVR